MIERGLSVVRMTLYHCVQTYAPEIDKRCRPHLKQTNDSWRVDETYVKVRGKWMYLYRALDSAGNTLDFLLNATRSRRAARRFCRKVLGGKHVTAPRVINVDKNPTTIGAVRDLKRGKLLPEGCKRRPSQLYCFGTSRLRLCIHIASPPSGVGIWPHPSRIIYEEIDVVG